MKNWRAIGAAALLAPVVAAHAQTPVTYQALAQFVGPYIGPYVTLFGVPMSQLALGSGLSLCGTGNTAICAAGGGGSASPGGSSGQIQVNNGAGGLGGITPGGDVSFNATTGAFTVGSLGGMAVSLGGSFNTTGAFALTLHLAGATNITLPTAGTLMSGANNLSDLGSAGTARANLGLGGLATLGVGTGLNAVGGNATVVYGTAAGTAAQGNDSRIAGALEGANNLSDVASSSAARVNLGITSLSMTLAGHVVSLGGTQTFAASDLSNGTTGSGATVLATSPTLTTPNLGTPAAINLANATNLPGSALPSSGVTAGTYGDGTHVPQVTVDATGRITSASSVAITGGAGSPGGTSGQIQVNQSGAFAGVTPGGDVSFNATTGAFTVSKTGGVAFARSATIDTTNASNITAGTLPSPQIPCDGTTISCAGGVISAITGGSGNVSGSGTSTVGDLPTLNNTTTTGIADSGVALPTGTFQILAGNVSGTGPGLFTLTASGATTLTYAGNQILIGCNCGSGTVQTSLGGHPAYFASTGNTVQGDANVTLPTQGSLISRLDTEAVAAGNGNDTTEDTLESYNLPAGILASVGQSIGIRAAGTIANHAATRTLRLYFGTTLIMSQVESAANAYTWDADCTVVKTGANTQTQTCSVQVVTSAGVLASSPVITQTNTQTDTSPITIKITGQTSAAQANDVTANFMMTELRP